MWLLSRRDRVSLGYGNLILLDAAAIRLCVLAPSEYYGSANVTAVAEGLNIAVRSLGLDQGGAKLSFEFQEFSNALLRSNGYSDEEALSVIDERRTIGNGGRTQE